MPANEIERPSGDVGLRLTYAEIAARLGISGDAARQLVRRRGWFRIVPNRRGPPTTVVVPEGELAGERRDTRHPVEGGMTPDGDRGELWLALSTVDRLSVQLTEANARADAERVRADRAEDRVQEARQQADRAEARAEQERLAADRCRGEAEAARGEATMAREATKAEGQRIAAELAHAVGQRTAAEVEARLLREAENARQQLGRWRRAWRGWRGR